MGLPVGQLTARARAVLATGDRVTLFLLGRYLGPRLDAERQRSPAPSPERQAVAGLLREMEDRLGDPKAAEEREMAERRISSAQVLSGRVRSARRELDGTWERVREGMRRRYAL